MKIRALIVDDEPLARERLRDLLAEEHDVEIVGECGDGQAAIRAIHDTSPDLVFLDVQMPELDGFEVLQAIEPSRRPAIVFVTAYDAYAIQAFDVHALDYLLKPFDRDRFHRAMRHARERIAGRAGVTDRRLVELLEELEARDRRPERIVVQSGGRVRFVAVEEIDWIEGAGNYVKLHVGGSEHLLRSTLKAMEERLDPERFVRIHRSHIVHIDRVVELQPWFHGEYVAILDDGTELRSSRTYSDRLRRLIEDRS